MSEPAQDVPDVRLYVPNADGWETRIKRDAEKLYCYQKAPGEEFFHMILGGEIFLVRGEEKLCLRCALRNGDVTSDRLFWQHAGRSS